MVPTSPKRFRPLRHGRLRAHPDLHPLAADGKACSGGRTSITSAGRQVTPAESCPAPDGGAPRAQRLRRRPPTLRRPTPCCHHSPGPQPGALCGLLRRAVRRSSRRPGSRIASVAKAQDCPSAQLWPVGTGNYRSSSPDFKPNDVITMKAPENFRDHPQPAFAPPDLQGRRCRGCGRPRRDGQPGPYDYVCTLPAGPRRDRHVATGGQGHADLRLGPLSSASKKQKTYES